MADPTIQTFCCHHGNGSHMAIAILSQFNTNYYNGVCLVSSFVGMIGAIYQILPRREYVSYHRWTSNTANRGRKLIVPLAIADLLACVGVFMRSLLWVTNKSIMPATDDHTSVLFCALSSAVIQYFYTATWFWTLFYAIDMRLILKGRDAPTCVYHLIAWCIPAILTSVGLAMLYFPDANCHTLVTDVEAMWRFLPNYIVNYIPMLSVMILNPILYSYSSKDMEKAITCEFGQCTSNERAIIDSVKRKYIALNIALYFAWFPNLANGIFLWAMWFQLPAIVIITVWYMMAFLNPLQALLNTLVYRRWSRGSEQVYCPCIGSKRGINEHYEMSRTSSSSQSGEEVQPLLRNPSRISINNKFFK